MAYRVLISEPAENAFDEAVAYIAGYLGSPHAAAELADEYESVLDLLESNPLAMAKRPDYSVVTGIEIRCAHAKNYLVIYHVEESSNTVYVDAFMHESMDIAHRLGRA